MSPYDSAGSIKLASTNVVDPDLVGFQNKLGFYGGSKKIISDINAKTKEYFCLKDIIDLTEYDHPSLFVL